MSREEIELKLDEASTLSFALQIEAPEAIEPRFRFVCESGDMSYMFEGVADDSGEISFSIPPMKGRLTEGTHSARLEVLMSDKYFVPIEMDAHFIQPVKVQVESITARSVATKSAKTPARAPVQEKKKPQVSVRAGSPKVKSQGSPKKRTSRRRSSLQEEYSRQKKAAADISEQDLAALRRAIKNS